MATTTFAVRQFFAIPNEFTGSGAEVPTGTFLVTGSASNLIINGTRGNTVQLATDEPYAGYPALSDYGWWAGPDTSNDYFPETRAWGIIVGGNGNYTGIKGADGRDSYVSMWGFQGVPGDQDTYNTAFIALASNIRGFAMTTTASCKTWLRDNGYYYQYPVNLDGQSPNTGTGSDTV